MVPAYERPLRLLVNSARTYPRRNRTLDVQSRFDATWISGDARRGKNMFVLGMLCGMYGLDLQTAREQIAFVFAKKDYREGQEQALIQVLQRRDSVVLLPTGAGKSLIVTR